jgi:putative toxin-antitoxin system antitoxin component (TIGR02293 family)
MKLANKIFICKLVLLKKIAMSQTWKIRFTDQNPEVIETGIRPYHFFKDSVSVVNEPRESYGAVLDFHETSPFFDYLNFTTHDISEVMEVDPSTLFRWKKEDRKLSKSLTKNLLEIDQIIAKGIRIFGSEELLSQWLHTPNASLGDKKPSTLLKNPYQISLVDQALEAISWGNIL